MFMGAVCARSPRARRDGLRRGRNALKFFPKVRLAAERRPVLRRAKKRRADGAGISSVRMRTGFAGRRNRKFFISVKEIIREGATVKINCLTLLKVFYIRDLL